MRAVNRVVAALLALALLAAAVVTVVEIVRAVAGRSYWLVPHPDIAGQLHERTWVQPLPRAVLAVVAVLGLVLLVLGLRRSKPADIELASPVDGVRVAASRRSLERYLASAAEAQSGVRGASVTARRRRIRVTADSAGREPDPGLADRIRETVSTRLAALEPASTPTPQVTVRRSG